MATERSTLPCSTARRSLLGADDLFGILCIGICTSIIECVSGIPITMDGAACLAIDRSLLGPYDCGSTLLCLAIDGWLFCAEDNGSASRCLDDDWLLVADDNGSGNS